MFDVLHEGDPLTIIVLIVLLTFLGSTMTERSPAARIWGNRIAAISFALFGLACLSLHPMAAEDWLFISWRSLLVAALVRALAWIVFAIVMFAVEIAIKALPRHTRRKPPTVVYVEKPVSAQPPPPPEPTQEELYAEAIRRYRANCEIISESPVDEPTRQNALQEEERILAQRIKDIMQ
jgi:hypothetical protein